MFQKNPKFKLEYFEITDETTLKPALRKNEKKHYRAFIAAFLGDVRLIDTIVLN
jgi:pantoate--beta-alanine ligase